VILSGKELLIAGQESRFLISSPARRHASSDFSRRRPNSIQIPTRLSNNFVSSRHKIFIVPDLKSLAHFIKSKIESSLP